MCSAHRPLRGETHHVEGIAPTEWKEYLLEKALILKGWGGLVYQGERGVAGLAARTTLADFLAVRLLLERMARAYFVEQPYPQRSEVRGSLSSFGAVTGREASEEASQDRATTAYHILRALQLFPAAGSEVLQLSDGDLQRMVDVVVEYGFARRLRVWQAAYEWNLYSRVAAALLHHSSESGGSVDRAQIQERVPTCQVVCCIDDREESFRRYLEELSPDYQTFGTAGFFGVDAEFHSIYERAAPFCPANVVPSRRVEITAKRGSERRLLGFLKSRTRLLDASMFVENQSRSLLRGWVLALGGLLALVPLSLSLNALSGLDAPSAGVPYQDLVESLQLGVRRFGMLGVSGGAPAAIAAAAELPERISALTVVSGMAPLSLPGVVREVNPINRIVFGLGKRCPRVALACIAAMGGLWRRSPPLVDLWVRVLLPESDRVICRRPRVATVGRRAIGEGLTQGVRGPVSDFQLLMSEWQGIIERVRVPSSVWHGECDTYVPFAMGLALSQALKGSTFHAVPAAGHFILKTAVKGDQNGAGAQKPKRFWADAPF